MWNGRGVSGLVNVGMSVDAGPIHLSLAPSIWHSENQPFYYFVARDTARSQFASPFYDDARSLDMPSQFGVDPFTFGDLGESAIWGTVKRVDVGLSSSSLSWGPGARAHLLLGPDAPGIPRAFARTAQPIATPFGLIQGGGFVGTLTESRFFDRNPANDHRRLWAWNVEFQPLADGPFSLGISHAVLLSGPGIAQGSTDQMATLAFQIRSKADRGRVWAELGRMGNLPTIRDFLTVPYAGIAYVLGFERAVPIGSGSLLFVGEVVNLEQPTDFRGEPSFDFYTSDDIPQGWTQRGRVLGVPTGPGSQSQWLAVDWVADLWSLGLYGERVRWNEDAFLREYLPYPNRHDVTVRAGIRAGVVARGYELTVSAGVGKRLNYLFQNATFVPEYRTVDLSVPQLRVTVIPDFQ